jgi:hypothetical protein
MTAITVTPEIVRVDFLLKSGSNRCLSSGSSIFIISGFDGILFRWYFCATCTFAR